MTIDPRRMARRHAAEMGLVLLLVALVLVCVWSTVAYGQDPAQPVTLAGSPIDWGSAALGGGVPTTLAVLVLGFFAMAKRLGLSMPRIVIGGEGKTSAPAESIPRPPSQADEESSGIIRVPGAGLVDHENRIRSLERKAARASAAIRLHEAQGTRLELGIKELRDLAQMILVQHIGKGGE